jgi:hypothetical protein
MVVPPPSRGVGPKGLTQLTLKATSARVGVDATTTGQWTRLMTRCVTEPSTRPFIAPRPRVPITTRSAPTDGIKLRAGPPRLAKRPTEGGATSSGVIDADEDPL